MSKTRRSTRLLATAAMVVAGLTFAAPVAHAGTPGDVCDAFPYSQSYDAETGMFRAPAWHYDKPVTVVYESESCTATGAALGNYLLSIEGTATVYEGDDVETDPIDERPFTSVLSARSAGGKLGWPVRWWSCFKGDFSYVWSIEDVYTFAVTAEDGRWLMAQTDPATGDTDSTSFNGCRKAKPKR